MTLFLISCKKLKKIIINFSLKSIDELLINVTQSKKYNLLKE